MIGLIEEYREYPCMTAVGNGLKFKSISFSRNCWVGKLNTYYLIINLKLITIVANLESWHFVTVAPSYVPCVSVVTVMSERSAQQRGNVLDECNMHQMTKQVLNFDNFTSLQ